MSDAIQHECAVTLLRLRRPPTAYPDFYGLDRLTLLLEKQHNRGQDGAGIAGVRLNPEPGYPACRIEKSAAPRPLADLLARLAAAPEDPARSPFNGELLLGHLRYGTFGPGGEAACHPFVHQSACLNRTLLLAGNFNLTNAPELLAELVRTGHHPSGKQDAALILGLLSHYLELALQPGCPPRDWAGILQRAVGFFDGAFFLCGVTGDGWSFALRDAAGIRPAFYYVDDEVAVAASERPAIQTTFGLEPEQVRELPPGTALLLNPAGDVELRRCLPERPLRRCVFERIYFSRGNDAAIHRERKALGAALLPQLEPLLADDWENTFFSYIPNTAQIAFHGLLEALLARGVTPRFGQVAVKDAKFRTFIADPAARRKFYAHVYDVTYGLVRPGVDTLVVLDDSIVRGNTLRRAILPMLDRLHPRRIVVASAAPPVRYPDGYGIDMAKLRELVAFEAAVSLLREKPDGEALLARCGENARRALAGAGGETVNQVAPLYAAIPRAELIRGIRDRLRPEGLQAELELVFLPDEALARCCPEHRGDWYFSGDYPTPGGFRMVNRALVHYLEGRDERAY